MALCQLYRSDRAACLELPADGRVVWEFGVPSAPEVQPATLEVGGSLGVSRATMQNRDGGIEIRHIGRVRQARVQFGVRGGDPIQKQLICLNAASHVARGCLVLRQSAER